MKRLWTAPQVAVFYFFPRAAGYHFVKAMNEPTESLPEFPFELIRVPGSEAVAQSLKWREEWRGTFTPAIIGTNENAERVTEFWDEVEESPEDLVKQAKGVKLPSWFEARMGEDESLDDFTDASAWNTKTGAGSDFQSVKNILNQKFYPFVLVARIPSPEPCDVPAYLKLGGWNACPCSEEHVAVWEYWQKKYGAEILCATGDVIEATVSDPPSTKEECYALAREQFGYCEDIVTQGVGSIDALAALLYRGKAWYFWWD